MSNRQEAILRELNLYPLWQRRGAAATLSPSSVNTPSPSGRGHGERGGGGVRDSAGEGEIDDSRFPHPHHNPPLEREEAVLINGLGWPELKAMVRDCTACKLRAGCTQTVFGVGDEQADWLFVGEGPGADEDAHGEPFVGQAGKLLDNMLAAIQLKRGHSVYITNIVKCRPPGNRTPHADEITQCLPYLERQIGLIQPKLIVALGKTAATALLGKEAALDSLRGQLHDYRSIPLIVTYHPAHLLRTPPDKAKAWQDLRLAVETMRGLN